MRKFSYLLLLPTLWFLGCGTETKTDTGDNDDRPEPNTLVISQQQFEQNGMALGTIEVKTFPRSVEANGMIDVPPENRATISAIMGGYIKKTPLLVGDQVTQGQLLVTLENPEFVTLQQNYLETKEQLRYLESEYERQQILYEEKISSEKNYLRTESEYKTAQARYNGLRKQLLLLHISPMELEKGTIVSTVPIYAPISGSVTQVFVSKGSYVSPSAPVMEIVNNDHIHLELSVFEKDIMLVEKGQPIRFQVPEASETTYEAEVHLVGTAIGAQRTIKVHGHLKNEEAKFLTGMFVTAQIITDSIVAPALPSESFVEGGTGSRALRLLSQENNTYRFENREITTGESYADFTRILDTTDLDTNGSYLVKGVFNLIDTAGEDGE